MDAGRTAIQCSWTDSSAVCLAARCRGSSGSRSSVQGCRELAHAAPYPASPRQADHRHVTVAVQSVTKMRTGKLVKACTSTKLNPPFKQVAGYLESPTTISNRKCTKPIHMQRLQHKCRQQCVITYRSHARAAGTCMLLVCRGGLGPRANLNTTRSSAWGSAWRVSGVNTSIPALPTVYAPHPA
eukprot:250502-Chlamydomonas_euryale.AAC.9